MNQKRYNTFTALRWEYWAVLLSCGGASSALEAGTINTTEPGTLMIAALMHFALGAAMFTVTAARCRDAGLNGWWCLASMVPFVSVYFGCIRSDDHPKKLRAIEKLRVNEEKLI